MGGAGRTGRGGWPDVSGPGQRFRLAWAGWFVDRCGAGRCRCGRCRLGCGRSARLIRKRSGVCRRGLGRRWCRGRGLGRCPGSGGAVDRHCHHDPVEPGCPRHTDRGSRVAEFDGDGQGKDRAPPKGTPTTTIVRWGTCEPLARCRHDGSFFLAGILGRVDSAVRGKVKFAPSPHHGGGKPACGDASQSRVHRLLKLAATHSVSRSLPSR